MNRPPLIVLHCTNVYILLVWHSQLPQWVRNGVFRRRLVCTHVPLQVKNINNAATLTQVIQTHVTTVMSRYKGKILHWDVANEVIDDNSGALRTSVYYNVRRRVIFTLPASDLPAGVGRERAQPASASYAGPQLTFPFSSWTSRSRRPGRRIPTRSCTSSELLPRFGKFLHLTDRYHVLFLTNSDYNIGTQLNYILNCSRLTDS